MYIHRLNDMLVSVLFSVYVIVVVIVVVKHWIACHCCDKLRRGSDTLTQ